MSRTNVQLGGQISANLVDQDVDETGPNRLSDFTSPIVSKKKIVLYGKSSKPESFAPQSSGQYNIDGPYFGNADDDD